MWCGRESGKAAMNTAALIAHPGSMDGPVGTLADRRTNLTPPVLVAADRFASAAYDICCLHPLSLVQCKHTTTGQDPSSLFLSGQTTAAWARSACSRLN